MWTSVADIQSRVRRRWDDGTLLKAFAAGDACPEIDVPLRGPRPSEIGERLADVQQWAESLRAGGRDGSRYHLRFESVGGRVIGRNRLPRRAVVDSYDQAWALLGTAAQAHRLLTSLDRASAEPVVRAWVEQHPLKALSLAHDIDPLAAAYRWLDDHRWSGRYLREVTAPGVDTKFAERHRAVLAQLLGVSSTSTGFITDLGLRPRPGLVRMRPSPTLGLLAPVSELALRDDELSVLDIEVRRAVIVENEITYLSVPVPTDGVVLWGKGFDVQRAARLPWLRDADVAYWGDIDTHGFAILDRLRSSLAHARSILMDRETLLAHRERWGTESAPTAARLDRLTPAEGATYSDLVEDRLGATIRLEQERIDWAFALERLPT